MPMPFQPMPQPQPQLQPQPQPLNASSFKPFVPSNVPVPPVEKPKGFADMMNQYEQKAVEKKQQEKQDFDDAYGNEDYGQE